MIGLSPSASKISLVGLAILLAAALGYFFGAYGTDQTLLQIALVGIAIPFAFTLSIEWLIWISLISVLLAETHLIAPGSIFYLRYAPMGLLTLHGMTALINDRSRRKYLPGFLLFPAVLLCLLALASTLYAFNATTTFQKALAFAFAIIGFGTTLPFMINGPDRRKRSTYRLLAICMFFLLISLSGLVTGQARYFMNEANIQRFQGVFNNPNTLGVVCMFILLGLLASWRDVTSRLTRLVLGAAMLIVLSELLLSGSRASLLGLAVGIFIYLRLSGSILNLRVILLSFLVLGAVALFVPIEGTHFVSGDTALRPDTWAIAFDIGMRSPVIGSGFSTDEILLANAQYVASAQYDVVGGHNEYLRIFVGLGVLGLGVLLWLLTALLFKAYQYIQESSGTNAVGIAGLLAIVSAAMVNAIFEDGLLALGGASAFLFWYFAFTLATAIHRNEQSEILPGRH